MFHLFIFIVFSSARHEPLFGFPITWSIPPFFYDPANKVTTKQQLLETARRRDAQSRTLDNWRRFESELSRAACGL